MPAGALLNKHNEINDLPWHPASALFFNRIENNTQLPH
jgi:hypothetical protein